MDMKLAAVALILLAAACTSSATPQASHVSPSAPAAAVSPSPGNSPAPAPPSPSWTLGLGATAVSTVDFSCRLPVFDDQGQGPTGGFIDFPSGEVTPDPAAATVSVAHFGRELVGQSYLHYYDRAYSRWLPVSRNAVSPDGSHYAYADRALGAEAANPPDAILHVVDVRTGAEQTFDDGPSAAPYEVLDYAAAGIYLVTPFAGENGLWLMDPGNGDTARVATLWDVQGSGGRSVFWLGAVNPSDPQAINGTAPDELDRLNLADGSRAAWFYRPGSSVHFVTEDVAGNPVIIASGVSGPAQLLLLDGPGVSRSIWVNGDQVPAIGSPIADSHGLWFGAPDGIFLYSAANGMQKVSNQGGYPANGCF